jgi:hypothetical protein
VKKMAAYEISRRMAEEIWHRNESLKEIMSNINIIYRRKIIMEWQQHVEKLGSVIMSASEMKINNIVKLKVSKNKCHEAAMAP